jgi:hypothetical protein
MSWFTDARVKRLKRERDELVDQARAHVASYLVLERIAQARLDQANRLMSENANVRSRIAAATAACEAATAEVEASKQEARSVRILLQREREISRERLSDTEMLQGANRKALERIAELETRLASASVGMAVYPPWQGKTS